MNQQQQQRTSGNSRRGTSSMVNVLIGGKKVRVDAGGLKGTDWDSHHGQTARGTEVQSAKSVIIGESIIIRNGSGGAPLALTTDEFEVMAVQRLTKLGYTLTAPVLGSQQQ